MDKILLQGESKWVEYKQEYSNTLLKTICAYANYHDGFVIVGLKDSGEIVGVEDPMETRLSIENAINDSIVPKPFYEIHCEDINGKQIVIVKTYKGDYTPYSLNQKVYKRMDTSTIQVDKYAYEELILQGRNLSFEELISDHQALRFEELTRKLKQMLKIYDVSDDLYITLGLKSAGKFNRAAALLSDDNPVEHSIIQFIAYSGNSVKEIKDRQTISQSSIIKQYEACMDFYRKHINIREIIEGAYRNTIEEVPLVAYREAVANSIIHRDYLRNGYIRIEFFANRIEITSPGGLPIGISEEEYIEGRISVPRNRIIAEIFLRLKIIEKLATGIRRIKEYYRDYHVVPSFKVFEHSVMVTLPKINSSISSEKQKNLIEMDHLNDKERMILMTLQEKGAMTRNQIEKKLGLKKSQTIDLIANLRSQKRVIQIGKGRATKYVLMPNP